jgi:nitronate monooxygenase
MILAGGVTDGASMLAALAAGYDLVYMGTLFIATTESAAPQGWKDAVVSASIDDIELTREFTGLPTSMIRAAEPVAASPTADGFHMSRLDSAAQDSVEPVGVRYSAGHSAACVDEVLTVPELVERVERQFHDTRATFAQRWGRAVRG